MTEDDRPEAALVVDVVLAIHVDEVPRLAVVDDQGVVGPPVPELARHPVDEHLARPLVPLPGLISLEAHSGHATEPPFSPAPDSGYRCGMAKDLELFIAGEWTEGTGEDHYEVHSPSTGEHLYNVPKASAADIDRAVAAAREATEEMRHWTAFERADLCLRIYDLWQDQGRRSRPHPVDGARQAIRGRGQRRHRRVW